jgi:ABC-type nitrate/sulfonate/bicarbonate transport system substrate-binding protein
MAYDKEYQKQYRLKNREKLIAYKKAWVEANPEKVKENSKKRYSEKKQEIKSYVAQYKKNNPHKANANKAKRKAAKSLRTPKWLSDIDFERIQTQYRLAEILTKLHNEPWHVDHIIPLQGKLVSGFHVPSNLQVIRGSDNCSKQNTFVLG